MDVSDSVSAWKPRLARPRPGPALRVARFAFCPRKSDALWPMFYACGERVSCRLLGASLCVGESGLVAMHVFRLSGPICTSACLFHQLRAGAGEHFPTRIMILSVAPFTSVNCCLICFEVVLLGAYRLKMIAFS